MADREYIQIEDEKGVYDCTNSLTGICDDVVGSTTKLSVLVKEKHKLFARAKVLSTSLIKDLHALNKYMKKTSGKKPASRSKKVVAKRVRAKKVVRKRVAKRTVSKRVRSKDSMKSLKVNLKKINKALK